MSFGIDRKKPAEEIVVLYGKNTPSGVWSGLKGRRLPVHLFLVSKDGKEVHYSPDEVNDTIFPGNGHSRDGEIECINTLHSATKGVAAIVLVNDGFYPDPNELKTAVTKIRSTIPDVKVIVLGSEIKLTPPADAFIADYNQFDTIAAEIRKLVPQLQNQKQRQ